MDEQFIQEFKKSYYQNGEYDITSQVPYLSKLADSYKQKYEADGDWKDCLKVRKNYRRHINLLPVYTLCYLYSNGTGH